MNNQREDGAFAVETYCYTKVEDYEVTRKNYAVVYADNEQPSNCVWFVPNTWDNQNV